MAALLLTAGIARADIVIVEEVDGMAQEDEMTIMVSGDNVRTDVSPQISMLTNATTGDVTTLMHPQKCYMVIPAAMSKALLAGGAGSPPPVTSGSATAMASATPEHSLAPIATGKTQKINGCDASEYIFSNGNMKATYWMSSNFPNGKLVTEALEKFEKGGLAAMTRSLAPDFAAFHGVPVKCVVEINGQKITTLLISATEEAVDPAEYKVPPGYSQMKMPGLDSGGGVDW